MSRAVSPLLVTLPLVVLGLAGCVSDPTDLGNGPGDVVGAIPHYVLDQFPVDLDHDHSDPLLHGESFGLGFTSYHSCAEPGTVGSAVRGFTDIAFAGDYAFVGNARGFCVLDVSDPAALAFVAQYEGEPASDIEVSADGNHVFLLTQRNRVTNVADPATNPTANLPRGVIIVNVEDKSRPVFESYYPVPTNGVHTAAAYLHGQRQLLFIQSYDWVPPGELLPPGTDPPAPSENAPLTQRIEITELTSVGGRPVLERIGTWSLARPQTEPFVQWFPHDAFAQFHPVIEKHLLYVAYWDAGLVILDIDDPAAPRLVSRYSDIAPSIYNQYHDVKAFDHPIAGRHITVTGPELPESSEAGLVRVFDTTDPAQPVQIGTWRLPENPATPGGFLFSPHVFTLHDGFIFIGHNHGGVWAIDVGDKDLLAAPATAGYFFPRGDEATGAWSTSSTTWGAYVHEGYIYATEASSGIHVLKMINERPPAPEMTEADHGHDCPPSNGLC